MQNDFSKAMDFRHACKVFDETKKISDEDLMKTAEISANSVINFSKGLESGGFGMSQIEQKVMFDIINQIVLFLFFNVDNLLSGLFEVRE